MKRVSLIFILIFALLMGNAQNNVPSLRGNKQKQEQRDKNVTESDQTDNQAQKEETSIPPENRVVPSLNPNAPGNTSNVVITEAENHLLSSAIDNAFLVVRSDYNIRDNENGGNITGTDFFGTVYSIVPLLNYGYGVDNRFLKPWKSDPGYDANKYDESRVFVDKVQYRLLKDEDLQPFKMNKNVGETLASGFYHVMDSTFQNVGLRIELGDGVKSGYMVWFYVGDRGEVTYSIQPTDITFNENAIFAVRQPANAQNIIGGAFLNMNVDDPGCIRLTLMGVARIDPYGSHKWELVKMQAQPTIPEKDAEPASNIKEQEAAPKEQQSKDDSIIPAQDDSKGKKKEKTKKEKSK